MKLCTCIVKTRNVSFFMDTNNSAETIIRGEACVVIRSSDIWPASFWIVLTQYGLREIGKECLSPA